MINQEEQMEIKILNKQGMGIRKIARTLGISRNTVRRYLRHEGTLSYKKRPATPSILDPYRDYIVIRLGKAKPHTIPATVIYREIQERGYQGGITLVRNYIREILPEKPKDPIIRFETEPGHQMQVDWTVLQGGKRRLLAFVAIMGYSRRTYVEFTNSDDESTFLQCHINAFEYFNGVPREILYDNMKTVVIERNFYQDGRHRFQKTFLDFGKHFSFIPRLCKPYRAQTKGKVERFIGYLKRSFYIPLITKDTSIHPLDIDFLNSQVKKWLRDVADERYIREIKNKPSERKSEELASLQSLPPPYLLKVHAPCSSTITVEQRDLSVYEMVGGLV